MKTLTGSEKQVIWATGLRLGLVSEQLMQFVKNTIVAQMIATTDEDVKLLVESWRRQVVLEKKQLADIGVFGGS